MSGEISTAGGEPTGTFRVYEDGTLVGYVLTMHQPIPGMPPWHGPLGRQGCTTSGTLAEWAPDKDGAIASLIAAYRAETVSG